jgi:hypothetical protein
METASVCVTIVAVAAVFIWTLPDIIERAMYRALLKFEALKHGEDPGKDLGNFSIRLRDESRQRSHSSP